MELLSHFQKNPVNRNLLQLYSARCNIMIPELQSEASDNKLHSMTAVSKYLILHVMLVILLTKTVYEVNNAEMWSIKLMMVYQYLIRR